MSVVPRNGPDFQSGSRKIPQDFASPTMPRRCQCRRFSPCRVPLPSNPDVGISPALTELLLKTGGPSESPAMMGLQDRFAGNPYWPAEPDRGSASPIVPVGYGSPFTTARSPRAEGMQTTTPLRADVQVDGEEQRIPDAAAPGAGMLPGATGSVQSPVTVQYKPEGTQPPSLPPRPREPQDQDINTTPGEIVVLPDGSKIAHAESPTGFVMSPKADLHDVAAQGRRIGEVYRSILANPFTSPSAYLYLFSALGLNVGQGGTYDHQRRGNMITGYTQLRRFRPIANVNVGLLAQQAGLTLDQTLDIAGTYARWRSSNADPNAPHGLDPETLHYIKRGHEIGQSGMFDPTARR